MIGKVYVYMCLHNIASNKSTGGNKTRLFLCLLHVSTSSRIPLAEAFRNNQIAACSTALRNAT